MWANSAFVWSVWGCSARVSRGEKKKGREGRTARDERRASSFLCFFLSFSPLFGVYWMPVFCIQSTQAYDSECFSVFACSFLSFAARLTLAGFDRRRKTLPVLLPVTTPPAPTILPAASIASGGSLAVRFHFGYIKAGDCFCLRSRRRRLSSVHRTRLNPPGKCNTSFYLI